MKKLLLLISLFAIFSSNVSASKTKVTNAETISVSDKEYKAAYHLSQMNASKKLLDSYSGKGVKVAVIDTGINIEHEEFYKNGEITISDDSAYINGNYYYNLEIGYSNDRTRWLNALKDETGHGTHVASLIAAQANGKGIVGIASNVELVVIKMAANSDGNFEFTTITTAIEYAYIIGADIINLSIAGYDTRDYYSSKISGYDTKYGIEPIIVAAAGNENDSRPYYPASATNVISVASASKDNYFEPAIDFTNYGNIDFAAPGYTYGAYKGSSTSYTNWYGTSFSSPLVAGLAALYKEQNPDVTRDSFKRALENSATKISETSRQGWTGKGLVNADNLLEISHATSLVVSSPSYPETILDPVTYKPIKQVLDLSDIGWKFDLDIEPYPSSELLPKTRYTYSSNPDVIRIIGNKLEVTGPGTTTIRVESISDSSIFGEVSLTVENRNELINNPIKISGENEGNILNLDADIDDFLDIDYDFNLYETWKDAYGIWAHDDNDYFVIEDDYYITDDYNGGGYKIYYQAIDYNRYDNKTGTYPYVIDYKIVNVINGIDINVESIELNESLVELNVGGKHSLNATILPENATNDRIIWSSSNESIASVSENGLIVALKGGTTRIVAATVDGNKTAECVINVTSNNENENTLVEDIYDAIDEFKVVREDPTDLNELKTLVEDLKTRYNEVDNKEAVINSDYITHMETVLKFLENEWYGVIRVRVSKNAKANNFEKEEWSICGAIEDKSKANRLLEIYDSFDIEVYDILDEMYDVTGTDGSNITIGQSIRFIAASLSLENNIDNNNSQELISLNSAVIYMTVAIAGFIFIIACIVVIILYKNKQKEIKDE